MALSSIHSLTSAVLNWLGQPDDPLVSPHVPDCIRLFEAEADRRLRTRWREVSAVLTPLSYRSTQEDSSRITQEESERLIEQYLPPSGSYDPLVLLPDDFHTLRSIRLYGNPTVNLTYLPSDQLTAARGDYYTIEGLTLRFAEPLAEDAQVLVTYQQGLTPLGPTVLSNWLLREHPDAYLFGTLAELEAFIANDERVAGTLARRDAVFASILAEDARSRVGGGKLVVRPDIVFPIGARRNVGYPVW